MRNVSTLRASSFLQVGVLGSVDKDRQEWFQWLLPDSGRAEVPLEGGNEERFPVGMAAAFCSQRKLEIEDGR